MFTNRQTAVIVGVLFIIGTVAGILSVVFSGSILNDAEFVRAATANENQFITGTLFVLLMGLVLALVPVMMFPVFKKYNEALALGYVVFRGGLETMITITVVISRLFLIIIGREYAAAGVADASYFQTLGAVFLKGHDAISPLLIIVFSLGAYLLYYLFYQSKLIPRWISIWGFVAISLHLATGFLILFGIAGAMATITVVMNLPIFLQEMVMAVWLIVKGFQPTAVASSAPAPAAAIVDIR